MGFTGYLENIVLNKDLIAYLRKIENFFRFRIFPIKSVCVMTGCALGRTTPRVIKIGS